MCVCVFVFVFVFVYEREGGSVVGFSWSVCECICSISDRSSN